MHEHHPQSLPLAPGARAAVAADGLIALQSTVAAWMTATLDCLASSLRGQVPASIRGLDPGTITDLSIRLSSELAQSTKALPDSPVRDKVLELSEHADHMHAVIALYPQSVTDAWIILGQRKLHVLYAALMMTIGDEVRSYV